jgi:hypothetical protein
MGICTCVLGSIDVCYSILQVNEELDNESKQPKDKKLSGLFSSFKRSTVR